jgi:antitoxin HicB
MFDYPVILTPDDGAVLVTFPEVPEAITFGANEEEALSHAVDALETTLSFYVDDRKPLPVPSVRPGLPTVRLSALESIKLAVYREILVQGVRKAELPRRLGVESPAG